MLTPHRTLLQADRPAELVNAWTADTKNSTRRDWRWVKLDNDYVEFRGPIQYGPYCGLFSKSDCKATFPTISLCDPRLEWPTGHDKVESESITTKQGEDTDLLSLLDPKSAQGIKSYHPHSYANIPQVISV